MNTKLYLPFVLALNLLYLIWITDKLNGILGLTLYTAEWMLFSLTILFTICHWNRTTTQETPHPPQGNVDIFVTCYNEPANMIEKTLTATTNITYPHKTIYLLDDGNRLDLHTIANKLGAKYITRPYNNHSKAGNLNNALHHTTAPYILTLDADQIPQPNILNELLGHFTNPNVAIITTKQAFDVHPQDFNHDAMFYDHMQNGKNTDGCAISTGSGVMYRRTALEKNGGFSTWNIVEDLTTTYELNQQGHISMYVNKPLTIGLAPQDLANIYKQRGTWAVDSLRLLFKKNPLFRKGLTIRQQLHYIELTSNYLISALAIPTLLILPIISLYTNIPVVIAGPEYLAIRAPGLIAIILFYAKLNKGHSNQQYWAGLWPVYLKSIILALMPNKITYQVTKKIEQHGRHITLIIPQLTTLLTGIIAIPFHTIAYGLTNTLLINTIWITLNTWWMYPIIKKGLTKKHAHTPTIHQTIDGTTHA